MYDIEFQMVLIPIVVINFMIMIQFSGIFQLKTYSSPHTTLQNGVGFEFPVAITVSYVSFVENCEYIQHVFSTCFLVSFSCSYARSLYCL